MKALVNLLFVTVIFVLFCSSAIAQTTYSWVGGTGSWSVATNWSPNGVPTSADNVLITASGTYTVTLDGDSTINDLTLGGTSGVQTLSLSSRILTINGTGTINDSGSVSISYSTISGSGTLTNYGTVAAYDGIFDLDFDNHGSASFRHYCSINNAITTQPNSTIHIYVNTTYNTLTIANGFTNHGLIYFTNAAGYTSRGTIDITSGTLINAPDGAIQSTSIPLYSGYGNSILASLDNQGTVTISQGFILNKESAVYTNSGAFDINMGGTLYLTQSGINPSFSNTGTLTVDSAAVITLNGGTFNYNSGTLDLIGSFSATSATVNFTPVFINYSVINLSSSTLNCAASFTNQNELTLSYSTISGSGPFTNAGTLTAYDGILDLDFDNHGSASFRHYCSINNAITTQPNSTIHVYVNTTYNTLTIANGFTNHGLIYFTNAAGYTSRGTIDITSGTLINAPDGAIQSTSIPLYSGYGNSILASLDNQGTVTISQGFILNKESAVYTNSGAFDINMGGTLYLTQSGINPSFSNTGTLTVDSAAVITLNGGTFNYNSGTLDLIGSFSATSATVNFTPVFINYSVINLSSSTLNCAASFTNQNELTLSYSTISGSGPFTNAGTLTAYDGILDLDFDNHGSASFRHYCSINNAITTQPNSTIHVYVNTTYNTLTIANGFTNHGLIYFTTAAGYTSRGTIDITNGALINAPDGTIESNDIILYPGYANSILAPLDNQGSMLLNNSMAINKTNESHYNSGEIQLNNATITFIGNQFENTITGDIGGNGTLNITNLSFVNNGSFIPGDFPGILNIVDDLPSAATALLNFDLGGPIIGEFYNSLAVAQTANYNGTININLIDGYVPNIGQEFILATCNSHNGSFLVQNGLAINVWKEFELVYEANELKLITRAIAGLTSPHAYDDFATANDGIEILVNVLYNDTDPNGENLTLVSVGPANNGVTHLESDNMVSYTPDSSFTGEDKFIYTIENISGCRTSGLVIVTVNPSIPQTPQLAFPADSSMNVAIDVNLGWYYSTEIDSYQVQISDVPTFNSGNEILYSGIVDTFATVNLSSQYTYYWRVLSQNAAGASAWSVTWNFTTGISTGIEDESFALPQNYALRQNYPNPFNPTTTIEYDLPKSAQVKIEIYNLLGKKIKTILDDYKNAGSHKLVFDSNNLASGVYLYRIEAGKYTTSKKMILLR